MLLIVKLVADSSPAGNILASHKSSFKGVETYQRENTYVMFNSSKVRVFQKTTNLR